MIKQENGVISLFSGDTGTITIGGFNPDHNYAVYLQFSDEDGNFVGGQLVNYTNNNESIAFYLGSGITDYLTVPAGEDYAIYYLGGKKSEVTITYDEEDTEHENPIYTYSGEDTIIPEMGQKKTVIVYRKVAEGPANA